tara:strand:- start:6837 stop:8033 length:1197 start_codon:yes stop_codon:yes gene_type:complete
MPKLSMWKPEKGQDYNFFDNRVREMFTIGGTGVNIHKFLGADTANNDGKDSTQPSYATQSEQNIQDLLFLENRDRKYDTSVYEMRGIYNVSDIDFDLTQFGLFLQNDTLFITVHMNDMVESLGRKLINGDVIELPHMRDFYPLDSELPAALRRYYVVQDGNRAAEGFSPTWYPHLWRVKCTPLVDSQEYRSIFDQTAKKQDGSDVTGADNKLRDLLSTYKQELEINTAIITEAEKELPKSGYDTSSFFVVPTNNDGTPADPEEDSADTTTVGASSTLVTADEVPVTPSQEGYDSPGGMAGDGIAPNGYPVTPSTTFPSGADIGDFVLRLDYKPNRLFRYDGKRWVKVEDAVRTSTTGGAGSTQKDGFVNNTSTYTDDDGTVRKSRQRLSDVLTPEEDN